MIEMFCMLTVSCQYPDDDSALWFCEMSSIVET